MAHGMGALSHWNLDGFVREFTKQGYACVLFDYR